MKMKKNSDGQFFLTDNELCVLEALKTPPAKTIHELCEQTRLTEGQVLYCRQQIRNFGVFIFSTRAGIGGRRCYWIHPDPSNTLNEEEKEIVKILTGQEFQAKSLTGIAALTSWKVSHIKQRIERIKRLGIEIKDRERTSDGTSEYWI